MKVETIFHGFVASYFSHVHSSSYAHTALIAIFFAFYICICILINGRKDFVEISKKLAGCRRRKSENNFVGHQNNYKNMI